MALIQQIGHIIEKKKTDLEDSLSYPQSQALFIRVGERERYVHSYQLVARTYCYYSSIQDEILLVSTARELLDSMACAHFIP